MFDMIGFSFSHNGIRFAALRVWNLDRDVSSSNAVKLSVRMRVGLIPPSLNEVMAVRNKGEINVLFVFWNNGVG